MPRSNLTSEEALLVDVVNQCIEGAADLQTILKKLKRDPKGGLWDSAKKTVRAIAARKEIEQKRKNLDDYEKTLDTRILTRLDTRTLEFSQDLQQLQERLKALGIEIQDSNVKNAESTYRKIDRTVIDSQFPHSLRFDDIISR